MRAEANNKVMDLRDSEGACRLRVILYRKINEMEKLGLEKQNIKNAIV